MISYGSRHDCAVMPMEDRSHQLGEGHQCGAAMPPFGHPSRSVYGGQKSATGTSPRHRLHQLGEGQAIGAAMPLEICPSRSVYGSQSRYAAMPCNQLLPPVRGGSRSRRSNAPVNTPSSISFTEAKNPPQDRHTDTASTNLREVSFDSQKCHLSNASQGKGQLTITGMS